MKTEHVAIDVEKTEHPLPDRRFVAYAHTRLVGTLLAYGRSRQDAAFEALRAFSPHAFLPCGWWTTSAHGLTGPPKRSWVDTIRGML